MTEVLRSITCMLAVVLGGVAVTVASSPQEGRDGPGRPPGSKAPDSAARRSPDPPADRSFPTRRAAARRTFDRWTPPAAPVPDRAERLDVLDVLDEREVEARAQFEAAFDTQARDRDWSADMEGRIVAALETSRGAPRLRDVECRSTLCRVELEGETQDLPVGEPFDGVGWWMDATTLVLVRDEAEIPLPLDE